MLTYMLYMHICIYVRVDICRARRDRHAARRDPGSATPVFIGSFLQALFLKLLLARRELRPLD